ncbi:MAG: GrpB family protein [Candidatus Bathyarchaeia archaeon]
MEAPVKVVDYDPNWPLVFEREKAKILSVIAKKVVAVEHVGSTAVPDLGAKPIIDIMVGIRLLSDAQDCIGPLETIGYEHVPEYEDSIPEARALTKEKSLRGPFLAESPC